MSLSGESGLVELAVGRGPTEKLIMDLLFENKPGSFVLMPRDGVIVDYAGGRRDLFRRTTIFEVVFKEQVLGVALLCGASSLADRRVPAVAIY